MKATGIVRQIDTLGRIVLPVELRRQLDVGKGDSLEIFTENNAVILKKYAPSCVFCGEAENVENFKGKNVCPACLRELSHRKD